MIITYSSSELDCTLNLVGDLMGVAVGVLLMGVAGGGVTTIFATGGFLGVVVTADL